MKILETKVQKDRDTGEYIVKAYRERGVRCPEADYYTDDKEDAIATAGAMLSAHDDNPILFHVNGRKAGQRVRKGDMVESFRGEKGWVTFFRPPHKAASEGKVCVTDRVGEGDGGEFYVSVWGMKWINRNDGRED